MKFLFFQFRIKIIAFVILVLLSAIGFSSQVSSSDKDDILCKGKLAELVVDIPQPFGKWVRVLCTPDGQALAPNFDWGERRKSEAVLWIVHNQKKIFMVRAVPKGLYKPPKPNEFGFGSINPKQDFRFVEFAGGELTGQAFNMVSQMYPRSFGAPGDGKFDKIYQLDAASTYKNLIQNMFFFVKDGTPRNIIVCLRRCQLSVSLDVMKLADLKKMIEEQ